jgi:pSer/pThr/pTyr-binding forkhead associated (FHA) protein
MRDGHTVKMDRPVSGGFESFLKRYRAKIVQVSGDQAGAEFPLTLERTTLGRGPGVALAFEDSSMSRQHAAIDFTEDGFRVQDLGSTNGVMLEGVGVQAAVLENGSRFEIGERVFQLVVEEKDATVEVYELPSEG